MARGLCHPKGLIMAHLTWEQLELHWW